MIIRKYKNLVIHKEKKKIEDVYFFDSKNSRKTIEDYKNNISLINFWATWCAPCKEEMPSLNEIKNIIELNIGHFIIANSIFNGLENSILKMRNIISEAIK